MEIAHSPLQARRIADGYREFLRADRVLLTGHSHQAWPDAARDGVLRAFEVAARAVDDKWGEVFTSAEKIRAFIGEEIGAPASEIALGQNTHELFTRFLSALPLRSRPRVVATGGEFHSVHRQLKRLQEAGLELTLIDPDPLESLAARLADALDERCAALVSSTVLFQSGAHVPELGRAIEKAGTVGARVFLDAYHSFMVAPLKLSGWPHAAPIYLSGGGYKYAQWGEGCCWLRVPSNDAELRPIFTGWFSDFEHLAEDDRAAALGYGSRPAERFAGSTFDPTSIFRAESVIDFFRAQGMNSVTLRALSLRQTSRLIEGLEPAFRADKIRLLTPREEALRGGFIALESPQAGALVTALRQRGIWSDSRGSVLRLGPAPYLEDHALDRGITELLKLLEGRGEG
ncbi:MAG: kynureninase [Myxococcota bacterium]|nr:kynureninase [Myxococcota bacterium]